MRWLLLSAALAGPAAAQAQPGRALVVDSATGMPLSGANVTLREGTSTILSQRTNDSGYALLRAPRSGAFTLELRAIGFATQSRLVQLDSGEAISGVFRLAQFAIHLDTVTTLDARTSIFSLTPGREFYRRHFERGIGQFISGLEIQTTKLGLIDFLGTIPGLQRVPSVPVAAIERPGRAPALQRSSPPTIAGENGFLLSTGPERCLFGRIDHWPVPALFDMHRTANVEDFLTPEDVVAVEVYAPAEVPPEWRLISQMAIVWVRYLGNSYLVGDTGPGSKHRDVTQPDDLVYRATNTSMSPPRCAFVQIWTRIGW